MKTLYTITIPTEGYVIYELEAESGLSNADIGELIGWGKGKIVEENSGDWATCEDWEIEGGDA